MSVMFQNSGIDGSSNIGSWDTSNVENMGNLFQNADSFNPTNLGNWDVGNVTTFHSMFESTATFNDASINNWNIGENTGTSAILMTEMFNAAIGFNSTLNGWETNADSTMAYVSNVASMFLNARNFNGAIGAWNVGRVTSFSQMFLRTTSTLAFNNGDSAGVAGTGLQNWSIGVNTTGPITMYRMFEHADSFNQTLEGWERPAGTLSPTDPGSTMQYVTSTELMFRNADLFNGRVDTWDLSRTTNFLGMFLRDSGPTAFNNGDPIGETGTNLIDWNLGANLALSLIHI